MISDRKLKLGLVGENIGTSLSPVLHRILADEKKVDIEYGLYELNGDLESFIKQFKKSLFTGINITKPYKKSFLEFVDKVEINAKKIGAINVLSLNDEKINAYNTDYWGAYQALKQNDCKVEGRTVIVLGAGGAARSAVYMAGKYGASKVVIVNRTYEKAEKIISDMKKYFTNSFYCLTYDEFRKTDEYKDFILINATSVGMKGFLEESILDDEIISGASFFMDMVYSPNISKSREFASGKGINNINGLDMLFFQGLRAFEIWTGLTFDAIEIERSYNTFVNFVDGESKVYN